MPNDPLQSLSCVGAHSKKKTLISQEIDRSDVVEKRFRWRAGQDQIDSDRLVFIDETWAKTNMTRTYGRSEIGARLLQKISHGRWQTTTFIGALSATGFVAPLTVDGPINGSIFLAWVQQHLKPVLYEDNIVVMDNLSSHKVRCVRESIESVGAELTAC